MYVALTRARRRLYLTFAQSRMLHGQIRYNVPSRFFHEIPEALLRKVAPPRRASWSQGTSRAPNRGQTPIPRSGSIPDLPWRIGQSVVHPKFGSGVIVSAEGRGADARVQVNFRNSGVKWLMLEYARLAPA